MATLVLTVAGAALGNALLPAGVTLLGATLSGATIGGTIGSMIGGQIDRALTGGGRAVEGPRLEELRLQGSTEGTPILRVFGRARVAGQIVWASNVKEERRTSGGGGSGKGGGPRAPEVTEYSYAVSLALGLCEGPIGGIGRIWADGQLIDTSGLTVRLYRGTEDQMPDALIETIEGQGLAPAYRGLAYLVFENLPLGPYGNRIPQLNVEVFRTVPAADGRGLDALVPGVCLIPGSGEFVLATTRVQRMPAPGVTVSENATNGQGVANLVASLDQLEAQLPAARSVGLVVCWYGDDLRCGSCTLRPRIEGQERVTTPLAWSVGGLTRGAAQTVSADADGPLLGGTPSDASVSEAIAEMKARGLSVVFYPFILMDVPPDNTKPDPYGSGPTQPPFPWRGRITCDPAPGRPGTADKTAAADAQVAAFFGAAQAEDFSVNGSSVIYTGPPDWGYRRFVLHYAHLVKAAGGIDAFLLGSELRGLTRLRGASGLCPAVEALRALAADVRAILGPGTRIGYAADWTEYGAYAPDDGTGDVLFPLDPLWADPAIDVIGIDWYAPLSDWRDGTGHLDAQSGAKGPHDADYLASNIEGGEGYAWYYADVGARAAQQRTPIIDTAHGEHWIFRAKDLRAWWSNPHHPRSGGIRAAQPTAWQPQMKPVWLTEIGCPAVDKGTNQPSIFFDPKSVDSGLPHFSSGLRDDLVQRRALEALLIYWQPDGGRNPLSSVYAGRMIDVQRTHVWAWDARPYPDFPLRRELWRDADQWERGHWLTGRSGDLALGDLVRLICAGAGVTQIDTTGLSRLVTGYVLDRIMSPREALEPLLQAYRIDVAETADGLRFQPRGGAPVLTMDETRLVAPRRPGEGTPRIVRTQQADLPDVVKLTFIEALSEYRQATVEARRLAGASDRIAEARLPIVMEAAEAQGLAETWLMETWAGRERIELALPRSRLALDPGDVIRLNLSARSLDMRITAITDEERRSLEGVTAEASLYAVRRGRPRGTAPAGPPVYGPPVVALMDLPLVSPDAEPHWPRLAAFARPWPGAVALLRGQGEAFALAGLAGVEAVMGTTLTPWPAGPLWRWDRASRLDIRLFAGSLSARSPADVLDGANLLAIETAPGAWELVQFAAAELVAPGVWRISMVLRGQSGSEAEMAASVPPGARVVLLDGAARPVAVPVDDLGRDLTWRAGPAGLPQSDPAYVTLSARIAGRGLRPLGPVRLSARRLSPGGDIRLAWIRRTRIGGDAWTEADAPLGEAAERYEVDILSGATVLRTVSTGTPSVLYTAADQVTDFGTTGLTSLSIQVAQVSDLVGRGAVAGATLTL